MQLHAETHRGSVHLRGPGVNLKDIMKKCEGSLMAPIIKGAFCNFGEETYYYYYFMCKRTK